jgi:subfamily B ATP-binding cassette protein MsbA
MDQSGGESPQSTAREFVWKEGRTFARSHWRLLARFVATSLGRTVTTVAVVLLIRDFLAGVLADEQGRAADLARALGQDAALLALAGILLLTFAASSVLAYHTQVVMQRLVRLLELDLMQRLMRHLLTLPVSFFDRQRKGDLLDAVRQDVSRTRSAISATMESATYGAQVVAYLASVLMLSPRLALMSVPLLVIAAVPTRRLSREMQRRSFELRRHGYHLTDLLLQLLQGVKIVKVYAGEEAETRNSIDRARRYFAELVAQVRLRALGDVVLESVAGLSVVIVIVMGGFEVMQGQMSFPALVAFLVAIRAMHGPLNNSFSQFLEVQRNWASVERVRGLLATEPEIRDRPDAVALTPPIRSLRFDHVSFGYRDGPLILRDVSLDVRAGQRVGIVGPSGAGKTTMVSLIARFYDPTSGRLLLNGRDLREYRLADLYRQMAIVTQDPFVFGASARDNIRYGCPDATDAEVESAARAADIHDDLAVLPQGYATLLGVGGRLLSGGQVQRLSVARALLKNAPLLILDEATSNLDSISELKVQAALERLMKGRTTIVIAHRLSTLRNADIIVVLDDGRAVGIGPHERLLRDCPLYRQLWETQQFAQSSPSRIEVPRGERHDLVLGESLQ